MGPIVPSMSLKGQLAQGDQILAKDRRSALDHLLQAVT